MHVTCVHECNSAKHILNIIPDCVVWFHAALSWFRKRHHRTLMKSCLWCDWIPISLAWDHFTDPTPKRKIIGAHATNKANHFINNKKLEVNDIVDGQQRGPTYLEQAVMRVIFLPTAA